MTKVTCNVSVSVDGFMAGPDQSFDNPIGVGGLAMHQWHFDPQGENARVYDEWMSTPGAYVMGRNMFSPGRGPWDLDLARLVGPRTSVSHTGLRAHPLRTGTTHDGRRHDVPLRHRRPRGGTHAGVGRGR